MSTESEIHATAKLKVDLWHSELIMTKMLDLPPMPHNIGYKESSQPNPNTFLQTWHLWLATHGVSVNVIIIKNFNGCIIDSRD